MPPNIYLDIDGVLLTNDRLAAPFAQEFLAYVLLRYPDTTYWLTTHCHGDAMEPIRNVGHFFSADTVLLMKKIKATDWGTAKTDGIDFSKPFLWFDDCCFPFEKAVLKKHGVLGNWIEVDLYKNPNQLKDLIRNFPTPVKKNDKRTG